MKSDYLAPLLGLLTLLSACSRRVENPVIPPTVTPPVRVAKVTRGDIPFLAETVGTAKPSLTVQVRARVDGQIKKVHFKEGGEVKEGQLLFEIDSESFEAALKEAEATLAASISQEKLTQIEKDRSEKLAKAGASPVEIFEKAKSSNENAISAVARDRAKRDVARLQLGYCKVTAPISGVAGKLETDGGSLTRGYDTRPVISINQPKPVYVEFALPERLLPQVRKAAAGPEPFLVDIRKSDQAAPIRGKVGFIDNQVDQSTGTILMRAEFPNADVAIWPGEFFEVSAILSVDKDAVIMPLAALGQGAAGPHAFVFGEDNKVRLRPLKVRRIDREMVLIAEGLAEGDQVVTEGAVRLLDGMAVRRIDNPGAP
ncbi:MAG: efflux RND transporter periplasmic adaptor subunit [Gemmataceae bacterium]